MEEAEEGLKWRYDGVIMGMGKRKGGRCLSGEVTKLFANKGTATITTRTTTTEAATTSTATTATTITTIVILISRIIAVGFFARASI